MSENAAGGLSLADGLRRNTNSLQVNAGVGEPLRTPMRKCRISHSLEIANRPIARRWYSGPIASWAAYSDRQG